MHIPLAMWATIAVLAVASFTGIVQMIRKVERLQAQVQNGLTHKVGVIEDRQTTLMSQVSEMHGWMKATHAYDGTDRRNG